MILYTDFACKFPGNSILIHVQCIGVLSCQLIQILTSLNLCFVAGKLWLKQRIIWRVFIFFWHSHNVMENQQNLVVLLDTTEPSKVSGDDVLVLTPVIIWWKFCWLYSFYDFVLSNATPILKNSRLFWTLTIYFYLIIKSQFWIWHNG